MPIVSGEHLNSPSPLLLSIAQRCQSKPSQFSFGWALQSSRQAGRRLPQISDTAKATRTTQTALSDPLLLALLAWFLLFGLYFVHSDFSM